MLQFHPYALLFLLSPELGLALSAEPSSVPDWRKTCRFVVSVAAVSPVTAGLEKRSKMPSFQTVSVFLIRPSVLGYAFFRAESACLTCRFCSNCSCVKPSATSLDKTLKNHMGKIRKECLVCNVCLPECSPLIGRILLVVDWLTGSWQVLLHHGRSAD